MLSDPMIGAMLLAFATALLLARSPLPQTLRAAFFRPPPTPRLRPDEQVVLALRPDPGVLGMLGLSACVALVAFQAGLVLMGADPVLALWVSSIPSAALASTFALELRKGWLVTNQRLLTRAGGELPLSSIRRLRLGPAVLQIEAEGGRGVTMLGLRDPAAIARQLQAIAARHAR